MTDVPIRLLRDALQARHLAVAHGDLTPRKVLASADEIGELAATFEGMVAAIARAKARKAGIAPGNTDNLTPQVRAEIAAIDVRRASAKKKN